MNQDALFNVEVTGVDRDHALARYTDPSTSDLADASLRKREGAANVVRQGSHRHRALKVFRHTDATADEVQIVTDIDGIWKRVSDLKNLGFVEPTGRTRLSRAGREQEVLTITDAGLAALAGLEEA